MAAHARNLLLFLADGSRARCKRGFLDQLQSKYNKEPPHETEMTYRASFKVNRFWIPQSFWRFCACAIHANRRVRMSWIHERLRGSSSGERNIHTICRGTEFCQIAESVKNIQRRPSCGCFGRRMTDSVRSPSLFYVQSSKSSRVRSVNFSGAQEQIIARVYINLK